jgi:alkaline phosphatase D
MERARVEHLLARRVGRRRFIIGAGALAGLAIARPVAGSLAAAPRFQTDPFSLGVASGDPTADGVVLWTRLAPDPLNGGGMAPEAVPVRWQLATDEGMRNVVQSGTALATPEWGHAVHVEVAGLAPARPYWYQFLAGGELSPVGRTRTAPAFGAPTDRFTFAFVSCQNWQQGLYPAYRRMAEEGQDLDLVIHLGDYIYEGGVGENVVRPHEGPEPTTLEGYRNRYALYKSDPALQAAHAACPWLVTWDDHEVDNNYADSIDQDDSDPAAFLIRRAAAYQAYYEHQPLRRASLPAGPDLLLYGRFTFGDLVSFHVLDTRQYRTDQPARCAPEERTAAGYCPGAVVATQTMLGGAQKRWLFDGLDRSVARWNVLAQQTRFAQHDGNPDPAERDFGGGDNWNGYVAERGEILDFWAARRPANPVVITGDIHSNWVYDLKADFDDPDSETLGTEYIGTSISSGGDRPDGVYTTRFGGSADNPHEVFFNNNKGYVRCTLDRRLWRADYRVVPTVRDPDAPIATLASFVTEAGRPGAQRA